MLTDMFEHCGRAAYIEACRAGCGVENCHAVYCSKCQEQLAGYDCGAQEPKWDLHLRKSIKHGWALYVPAGRHTEIEITEWDTGAAGNYDRMREAVEGWIEAVDVPAFDITIWVNEEGLLQGREPNRVATMLARTPDPRSGEQYDYLLVGPALITGGTDEEGETMALSTKQIEEIREYLERVLSTVWRQPEEAGDE